MALMQWGSALEVGNTAIDTQHKKLVAMVNALDEAMGQGKATEILDKLFRDLTEYTFSHFIMEERLMQTHAYPDRANHMRAHTQLKASVEDFQDEFVAGKPMVSIEVMSFLTDWWSNHIMVTDKALSEFLASKNVK